MKWHTTSLLMFLLGILCIGCTDVSPSQVVQEPIKIGFLTALTGEVAPIGEHVRDVALLAEQEINAQGGINGRPLKIIVEDSQCDASTGVSAATKLINIDKVDALVGGICSSVTLAVAPLAEASQTPYVAYCSSHSDVTDAGDYIFRVYPSDKDHASFIAAHAFEDLQLKNIGIIYVQTAYPEGLARAFTEHFEELGGNVIVFEGVPQGSTDVRSQLTKMKEKMVDGIFFVAFLNTNIAVIKQAKELGIDVPLLSADALEDPAVWNAVGSLGDGIHYSSQKPANFTFEYLIRQANISGPIICQPQAYDAVKVLAKAMRLAGPYQDPSGSSIKAALYSIQGYQGQSGTITFDENGDLAETAFEMKERKNGKSVVLPS